MIIPIKCFTCGMVIADKYRYYLEEVRKKKLQNGGTPESIAKIAYLTRATYDKTPEGQVLDDLGMVKICCRRHFIAHVDIE